MNTLLGAILEILFLIFFALLGMASIPDSMSGGQDGLYSNEGALSEKYKLVDENEHYKVYVLK